MRIVVIASEAKQSSFFQPGKESWIASSLSLLAMTGRLCPAMTNQRYKGGQGLGTHDMQQGEATEGPVKVEFDNFEHGFPEGFGPGVWGRLAYAVGILFAVF